MCQTFTARLDGLNEGGAWCQYFLCACERRAFRASSLGEPNIEYRHSSLSFNSHHPSLISQTSGLSHPQGRLLAHPSLKRPSIPSKTSKQAAAAAEKQGPWAYYRQTKQLSLL